MQYAITAAFPSRGRRRKLRRRDPRRLRNRAPNRLRPVVGDRSDDSHLCRWAPEKAARSYSEHGRKARTPTWEGVQGLARLHQLRGLGDAKVLKSLGHSPKGRHYRG